jgi:hypothetical protein
MRSIGWMTVIIIAALWGASEIRLPAAADPAPRDSGWRRTRDGWERSTQLLRQPVAQPSLHPSVVASLEILLVILALSAFPVTTRQVPRPQPESATASNIKRKRPRPVLIRQVSSRRRPVGIASQRHA